MRKDVCDCIQKVAHANAYAYALQLIGRKCGLEIYNPVTGDGYSALAETKSFEQVRKAKYIDDMCRD